jgi:branched-chain amino acid transport system substrate-binding protein
MPKPILLLIVAAALLIGAAPAHADPLKVGLIASQTGSAADVGVAQVSGAQLAASQLGAELVVRDDASTPDGAKAAMTDLANQGVSVVLGPSLSSAALAADPIAQARGLPVIAISNTASGITDAGDYIFRLSLPESFVLPRTVAVTHRRFRYERAALIWRSDQAFSTSGAQTFRESLARKHVKLVADVSYTGDHPDLRSTLKKIAKKQPEALFITGLTPDSADIIKQARRTPGVDNLPYMGGNGFNSQALITLAGRAADGVISGAAWNRLQTTPGSPAFVGAYTAAFRDTPDQFAALAYAGVNVAAAASARAGSTAPAAIRDAIPAPQTTILGATGWSPSRDALYTPVIQIVTGGRFVPLR